MKLECYHIDTSLDTLQAYLVEADIHTIQYVPHYRHRGPLPF